MEIFSIEPGLFIWSMLTFILLILLLYKFAFGPLMALQKQRQDEIHDSIRESERLRDEAHALLEDYKAKAQAERAIEKAHEQIERETRQALQEIKSEVAALTLAATEKVTKKTLTEKDHLDLINEAIAEIDLGKFSEN
jgi:F-type H+-transporting ATPase subunit b